MALLLGDIVPDFEAESTMGRISFHEWIGGDWAFFFSHPESFTPVCTTELGRTAQLFDLFLSRGVKPIGLSTGSLEEHQKWIEDVNDTQSSLLRFPLLRYPIISDVDMKVSRMYGMIHPAQSKTEAARSVFLIDNEKKLRLTMTYPMNVGRNFDEILRVIDALHTSRDKGVMMPADWRPGQRAIIPLSVSDEQARDLFPQGYETLRPYLRMVDITNN